MTVVGRVAGLARFPVKSLQGEELEVVQVDRRGLVGDRAWAVYTGDGGIGSGKTTRRFRRVDGLLRHRASGAGPAPLVTGPDGGTSRAGEPATDVALSRALGRPVRLRPEADVRHHDESPVHLVTTSGLQELAELTARPVDPRRFRANVLLETAADVGPELCGRELALGAEVVLTLGPGMPRCRMVDLPPSGTGEQPPLLTTIAQHADLLFGLQASVARGGCMRVGDVARLL